MTSKLPSSANWKIQWPQPRGARIRNHLVARDGSGGTDASAAAMSSFDGMQPTRAQVVPYAPPSMRTLRASASRPLASTPGPPTT